MRLKKLKVAGFKSFVDPTSVTVPSDLVGIVGPNGCGKSNVIDAVRWVMGESSAKTLRGDNMADVIFNGSTSRKPVGKASVELLFHNDGGKIPESYANFSEIGIKRTLTRDGKSEYFINNTRARRKDIQDIFRGTGLGPRSYSIIEQGMVSRIIESKPEDLRSFVEEAAGISKYKDRRRETENRIRHTRENLERVVDIIQELEKQLRRLQRQSQAAQRYKRLKEQEQRVQGELFLLRQAALEGLGEEQARTLAALENDLQRTIAEQRSLEESIETQRVQANEQRERFGETQARFYSVGSDISTLEQQIAHVKETRRQRQEEFEKLNSSLASIENEAREDETRQAELRSALDELERERSLNSERLEQAAEARRQAESAFENFQKEWEAFSNKSAAPGRTLEVQKSVINEQSNHHRNYTERLARTDRECEELRNQILDADPGSLREDVEKHTTVVEETATGLKQAEAGILDLRGSLETALDEKNRISQARHGDASRLHSLKEIQASALGEDDEEYQAWVRSHGLNESPQLVSGVSVADGWQQAADAVLAPFLRALVVSTEIGGISLENATAADLSLIEKGAGRRVEDPSSLAHYVTSTDTDLSALVEHVCVVEDVQAALSMRASLSGGQIAVTRDGVLVGANWIRLPGSQSRNLGLLGREEEIRSLESRVTALDEQLEQTSRQVDRLRSELSEQETRRNQLNQALSRVNREHADMQNRLGQMEARFAQLQTRLDRFETDREELVGLISQSEQRLSDAERLRAEAEAAVERFEAERAGWISRREELSENLDQCRREHQSRRDAKYDVDTRWQVRAQNLKSLEEAISRLERRRVELAGQSERLNEALNAEQSPEEPLQARLNGHLETRAVIETELNISRQESERIDLAIQNSQRQIHRTEQLVEQCRERVGRQKLTNQETALKLQGVVEQLQEHDVEALAAEMPEEANEAAWLENLENIDGKISRIGPVNLVAIEEFEEQSERKIYLDKQHQDLTSALETLEAVIRKIDRETRSRFKDTFDKLNQGFQTFFPQLFGGGSAVLELTDNDFLTTGVTVMARPPGKRNSTIHLLSGGEKALTAVSLLFSLFQLNPAPFCLLDEVDAPLDDANVERYCKTLKSLSRSTQLLVITHNKITMEASDILIGVTMSEPGVSRIVAVDVEQAVEMAAT